MKLIGIRGMMARESCSGQCSYEEISAAIDEALADGGPVVLDFDCQGGDAIGVKALADSIFARRDKILAYVSGYCASAAYYLAAACGRIVAAEDALVGSIGSIGFMPDRGDAKVAALSPLKNSGEDLQLILDESCERFLSDVAKYRGLNGTLAELSQKCGAGALLPARAALSLNLIDGVGTMDDVVDREELDVAGVAAMLPKLLERLDELARKIDSADERVGLLEERMRKEEEAPAETEVMEAEGEDLPAEEEKKDEEEKQAEIVNCLIDCLKRQGSIPKGQEANAIKVLNVDRSLFRSLFVDRTVTQQPTTKLSMSAKKPAPAAPRSRDERARLYMTTTGCTYAAALAHELEKERQ